MSHTRAVIILLVGATIISSSPVLVKLAAIESVGPTVIGFWRTLIGGLALLTAVWLRGKSLRLSPGALRFSILAGFFFFIDLYVWHRSVIYAGAGLSTILGNTQVFVTAVLSFLLFKERVTLKFVVAAVTAFAGVVLLVGLGSTEVQFTETYIKGILFGLATGFAYAAYLISLKRGITDSSRPDSMVFIAWASLFSAMFLGATASFESEPFLPSGFDAIASILGLGLIVQALGWWIITKALPSVPTPQAGLILLLQPTLAMLWGVIFFAEYLTAVQIAGAVITLLAMYIGSVRHVGEKERATPS
jgi:drug/metabolite transporter (DMT)-like permease